jgi:hypothetical protein
MPDGTHANSPAQPFAATAEYLSSLVDYSLCCLRNFPFGSQFCNRCSKDDMSGLSPTICPTFERNLLQAVAALQKTARIAADRNAPAFCKICNPAKINAVRYA